MNRLDSVSFKIFDLRVFLGKNHENHHWGGARDFSGNPRMHSIYEFSDFSNDRLS